MHTGKMRESLGSTFMEMYLLGIGQFLDSVSSTWTNKQTTNQAQEEAEGSPKLVYRKLGYRQKHISQFTGNPKDIKSLSPLAVLMVAEGR